MIYILRKDIGVGRWSRKWQFSLTLSTGNDYFYRETPLEERPRRKNKRVRSLDAFRGLAIVIMIFVNYGGGGYSFFAQ